MGYTDMKRVSNHTIKEGNAVELFLEGMWAACEEGKGKYKAQICVFVHILKNEETTLWWKAEDSQSN